MTGVRPRFVLVTGTDTGVGKTVATAALAVWHAAAGRSVRAVKPAQTGLGPGESGDADEVRRLSGADVRELVRLAEPLAPESAARRSGAALPPVADLARLVTVPPAVNVTLVEGSGGVRVGLDAAGGTILDLGAALTAYGEVEVVVVTRAGLGTLSHTCLSVDAIRAAGLPVTGLVLGCWPDEPGLAETVNREDLPRLTGAPMLAMLPAGASGLTAAGFRARVPGWFG